MIPSVSLFAPSYALSISSPLLAKKNEKLSYEFLEISKVMLLAAYLQLYRRKSMHVWQCNWLKYNLKMKDKNPFLAIKDKQVNTYFSQHSWLCKYCIMILWKH